MTLRAVVFDIGGVLVDWQPQLAWADVMSPEDAADFMTRVDFRARNARADAGARFDDLAAELADPNDARLLADYVARYPATVIDQIPGTWAVLDALAARGVAIHAITNWSAETWPRGLIAQPRLAEVFGVTIVSGQEGIAKPDPRIFALLCERAGLAPADCVFVDDMAHNVKGARAAGMDAIHFTTARALAAELTERGLL